MSLHKHDTSDESLLGQYRAGREEAFTLLFRRYSRRLFGFVLGIVHDQDLADDVIQKVFVKLARRPEIFKPRASFSSWIHQVARNAALDALKSSRGLEPGRYCLRLGHSGARQDFRPFRR